METPTNYSELPDPRSIIARFVKHHSVDAVDVLAALMVALGRYHLLGNDIFPEDIPAPPGVAESDRGVSAEVLGHMLFSDPPFDPQADMPKSLLEAVARCVRFEKEFVDWNLEDASDLENFRYMDESDDLRAMDEVSPLYAVIALIFREYMNAVEHKELEWSVDGDE